MDQCPPSPLNPADVEALYPNSDVLQDRVTGHSALCSLGVWPLTVTGFLRQALIGHFCDTENIASPEVRDFLTREGVWAPDPDGTSAGSLYIESLALWDPQKTEQRPALIIKAHKWDWHKLGIANMADADPQTGQISYTGLWQGAHTIFVVAGDEGEAQLLAGEIARILLYFGLQISHNYHLHDFDLLTFGESFEIEESDGNYAVPLTVAYWVPCNWMTHQDAPRLKRFQTTTNT